MRALTSKKIYVNLWMSRKKGNHNMLKLFLSSHGHMASGMKNTIEFFCGQDTKLTVFDAYVDEKNVSSQLNAFFETVTDQDQVVLLSDLYGGSVNQQMYLYLDRPNTMLVAGVNLALVLELTALDSITEDGLERLVEQSRQALKVVKQENTTTETEEDFF